MSSTRVIDAHTHFIPREFFDAADHPEWGAHVEMRDGAPWIAHEQGFAYPFAEEFLGEEAKFSDMKARRIDISIMSLSPSLFYYWIDGSEASAFGRMANDALAKTVAESGGRLEGLATLPMQDPEAAADELVRAVQSLGLRGAQIGTTIEGEYIDGPAYSPVWAAAEELRVPIVLHPYYVGPRIGYEDYYLTNVFVNPMDTALAASRIIYSGLLDRYPSLRFMLVHAGGFLPYQIGRLDHGWRVRTEARAGIERAPSEYLDRFYFDTITHHDSPLEWLIGFAGEDRVILGTDLPFDMADEDPVGRLERVATNEATRARIAESNARAVFGLELDP